MTEPNDYPDDKIARIILIASDGEIVPLPLVYVGDEIPVKPPVSAR